MAWCGTTRGDAQRSCSTFTSFGRVLFLQRVAFHQQLFQRAHVLQLVKLLPVLYFVVGHVKRLHLLEHGHTLQFLNQAVRYPKLLQCVCYLLKTRQVLDVVPPQRQNFQIFCGRAEDRGWGEG